jgi:hypothetical protein
MAAPSRDPAAGRLDARARPGEGPPPPSHGQRTVALVRDLEGFLCGALRVSGRGILFGYGAFGMRLAHMQMGYLRYMSKALDHRAFKYHGYETVNIADALGIEHRGTDGAIAAKRAGWTENIGPTARRRAGWRELRHLDELTLKLNPPKRTQASPSKQRGNSGGVSSLRSAAR